MQEGAAEGKRPPHQHSELTSVIRSAGVTPPRSPQGCFIFRLFFLFCF
uniref:Uncharacterized protein n=1 Tax=Anguilla anguilla TaxID=7936 RepID=A0A0E9PB97_ANGAN